MQFQKLKKNLAAMIILVRQKGVAVGLVFLLLFVFWLFFYRPNRSELKKMEAQVAGLEREIKMAEFILKEDLPPGDEIRYLSQRLASLENKFPSREGEGLKRISDLAAESGIELISMRPGPREPVVGRESLESISVSYQLRASFFDLVNYLEDLREELPVLVVIDFLDIREIGSSSEKLNINMGVRLFLTVQS